MGNQIHKRNSDLENQKQTVFVFEIDNFFAKKDLIQYSPVFLSGGCKWYIKVLPRKVDPDDYVCVYLHALNYCFWQTGWRKRANIRFTLDQSGKVLYDEPDWLTEKPTVFCAEFPTWGFTVPHNKLREKGVLEKEKLIIRVEIKVIEVIHDAVITGKETLHLKGFEVLYSQVESVCKIFEKHPDIAINFKPKAEVVKTAYMNLLLGLIETLRKPPQSFTETKLMNARNEMSELTEAGFKLDWLEAKLEKVSLAWSEIPDGSEVEEMEERIENLELTLSDLKIELKKKKAKSAAAKLLSFDDIL